MKVSELTGAKLDYWVAKAQYDDGREIILRRFTTYTHSVGVSKTKDGGFGYMHFAPSGDWSHGGPIIEREKIRWQPLPDEGKVFCWTHITKEMDPINGMRGDTILQAAMRCFVASKFGEGVSDEPTP